MVKLDYLVYDLAKLLENGNLVFAVASAEHQARATSDIELVFFGPFDDL
jgi:hypothetical protein